MCNVYNIDTYVCAYVHASQGNICIAALLQPIFLADLEVGPFCSFIWEIFQAIREVLILVRGTFFLRSLGNHCDMLHCFGHLCHNVLIMFPFVFDLMGEIRELIWFSKNARRTLHILLR